MGAVALDSLPLTGVGLLPAVGLDGELFLAGKPPSGFPGSTATAVQTSFGGAFGAAVARIEPGADVALPFVSRVENAASQGTAPSRGARVAPGEILTLRGQGLGPLEGVQGLATELAGVRVTFDGDPAPLLWVQDRQVNLIAPWALDPTCIQVTRQGCLGDTARLVVERDGIQFGFVDLGVARVRPGVFTEDFTGRGQIVMLNQDGSRNSYRNPARTGEVVTFWATGLGPIKPPGVDGRVQGSEPVIVTAVLPVTVTMKDIPAEVRFVGVRPGMVHGLFQIQAVAPEGMEPSSGHWVRVEVGGSRSQGLATISVE